MNTHDTATATGSAKAEAANFQVAELEPRLENLWPGGQLDDKNPPANPT